METRIYKELCEDSKFIRTEVFMKEQGFENEFDDLDAKSVHIVAYENDEPVGNCRYEHTDPKWYHIGRVAVLKEYRGLGIGSLLIHAAHSAIEQEGGRYVYLDAQVDKKGFYEKLGYHATDHVFDDEGVPHVRMEKDLTEW